MAQKYNNFFFLLIWTMVVLPITMISATKIICISVQAVIKSMKELAKLRMQKTSINKTVSNLILKK